MNDWRGNLVEERWRIEARRIADELHRSVAQTLFSIGMEAEAALEQTMTEPLKQHLETIRRRAAEGNREVRSLIASLRQDSPAEAHNPIAHLLEEKLKAFETRSGMEAVLNISPALGTLPAPVVAAVYRLVSEYLLQVAELEHSHAVLISLDRSQDGVLLTVQGGCRAASADAAQEGLFSSEIQKAVDEAGGELCIGRNDDGGLLIRAVFSLSGEVAR
ncbi:MAG: hypothetical protein HPY45_11595 [Anaerolineae bacterium]|nr:hypothetical protein [Anaerolineae bacterium]